MKLLEEGVGTLQHIGTLIDVLNVTQEAQEDQQLADGVS